MTEIFYEEVGKRIRLAREAALMTQKELADAVGYESNTAISLIESGKRRVQLSELEAIAKQLGCTTHYLTTGHEAESARDVKVALNADNDLDKKDVKSVIDFVNYLKSKRQDGAADNRDR